MAENDVFGAACGLFEGDEAPFSEIGFTLAVLLPRQSSGLYHRETKPAQAYAPFPRWRAGRPDGWNDLPWS